MTFLQRRQFLLAIASALIALLALAACGGGDDDDGSNTATATREPNTGDGGDTDTPEPTEDDGDNGDTDTPEPTEDDGDGGGSGDSPVDVCALLTTEEVEAALGQPIGDPAPDDTTDPFFSCTWFTENLFAGVTVKILTGADEDLVSYYELTSDPEEIDGLGDRA